MPPISVDEIIQKLNDLFDKIQSKVDEIRNKVNSIISKVPFFLKWAVDKFMDLWDKMLGKLGELWDWFTDKLRYVGDPFALFDTGEDWHTVVGEPGKAKADSIDDDHELLVDDNWTGEAATAYKSKVPSQESALRRLGATFASTVSQNLKTIAFGIATFWLGIIAGLVTFALCCVGASAATGTIIGLPAVPVLIISGVISFLVAAGLGLASLTFTAHLAGQGLRNVTRYAEDWPEFALS